MLLITIEEEPMAEKEIEINGLIENWNMDSTMRDKAKELVSKMTLEEKAGLCSGRDYWRLKPVERLGLSSIMMADGPHGLRKQIGESDNLGVGESVPAVCFPTASALACSFDRELAFEVGSAIGEECLQEEVSVVLGPGVNQKRSPLCGRNFEYFSEDPVLSGEMAASMIRGVQSRGIGTSLKHYAVNNQEKRRMTVSAVIDERALRETYLKAFEIAVKKGSPRTVMCAYNRVNGDYCSENEYLLTKILRQEWGFDGLVVSDWGAVNDRVSGIKAGMDLEMPGNEGINDRKIVDAVKNQILSEQELDRSACRVTELMLEGEARKKKNYCYDKEVHHALAVRAAEQSVVLLKNQDNILPGNQRQKAAVIGAFAKEPRYQGAGSSKINPIKIDNAWEELTGSGLEFTYAPGYGLKKGNNKNRQKGMKGALDVLNVGSLISQACEAAKGKEIVYLFAGLPEGYESEGFDREDLQLPDDQNCLIEAVASCNPNVVVVLIGGAPMELPWADKVKGILLAYLGGEGSGKAVANLLLGKSVPCGKLAETWPYRLPDAPSYHYFPGGRSTVEYRESIYVGYRYYETAGKAVRFPFGYGLSYTSFSYFDLETDRDTCNYGEQINLNFCIKNTGQKAAKETALIFVSHKNDEVFLPQKELRDFIKISLEPGETKKVSVTLDTGSFGYYNTLIHDWYAETGDYMILVGTSSDACSLKAVIRLNSQQKPQPDLKEKVSSYYHLTDKEFVVSNKEFSTLYGKELPPQDELAQRPYDTSNTLEDVRHKLVGKLILSIAQRMAKKVTKSSKEEEGMVAASIRELPLRNMVTSSEGMITEGMLEGILDLLNGHYFRGIIKLIRR
jgi:beta-glucosidase